ncbi:glycosyltransferase, partial [Bacteroidales bacterium OttesenSCG-928-A17]|nr:glycosyltransferase [Bacteroidales bacterium OttesenSCG-928-A17]
MNNASLQPKISVCLITYNHESFIHKAIESILEQKGNFKYEIVIGVDLSTDKTVEICLQYQKKYPEIIKVLETKERLGLMKNYARILQACTGEFIAFCSGDDYWIDPEKLQKQLTFLETHTTYGMVYSNYKVLLSSRNLLINNAHNSKSMPQGDCKDQFINGSEGVMTITSLIRREALNSNYFTFI